MTRQFAFRFFNDPQRLLRESLHDKIRNSHSVPNVGFMGDPTNQGKFTKRRFNKWYKLPKSAHRLYWRARGISWNK
jgi:hypothetical protein